MSWPSNHPPDEVLLDDDEAEPAPRDLMERLLAMAERYVAEEGAVAEAEVELERAKAAFRRTREVDLPDLFAEARSEGIDLEGGVHVGVTKEVYASIPKDRVDEAARWFDSSGNGALLKRTITVRVPRGPATTDLVRRIRGGLQRLNDGLPEDRRLTIAEKDEVHHQTLQAFVRAEDRAGRFERLPAELLGAFRRRVAEVKRPKADPLASE